MPPGTYCCRLLQTIGVESSTLFDELLHSAGYAGNLDAENPRIVAISKAMRDLLLYNSQGSLERTKLHRRYLEISKIIELILIISVIEGDLPQDLLESFSEAIAKLLADIYSGC